MYDVERDPWETENIAGTAEGREIAARLERVLEGWIDETGDFPPEKRRRGDNTDRVTGVKFTRDIAPMTDLD